MTNAEILDGRRDAGGSYKVDVSRGGHSARVSSEWFLRPDDKPSPALRNHSHSMVPGGLEVTS